VHGMCAHVFSLLIGILISIHSPQPSGERLLRPSTRSKLCRSWIPSHRYKESEDARAIALIAR